MSCQPPLPGQKTDFQRETSMKWLFLCLILTLLPLDTQARNTPCSGKKAAFLIAKGKSLFVAMAQPAPANGLAQRTQVQQQATPGPPLKPCAPPAVAPAPARLIAQDREADAIAKPARAANDISANSAANAAPFTSNCLFSLGQAGSDVVHSRHSHRDRQ